MNEITLKLTLSEALAAGEYTVTIAPVPVVTPEPTPNPTPEPEPTPTPAPVQINATPGPGGQMSGALVGLWSNGAMANLTIPTDVSGAYKLALHGRGDVFEGEPIVEVRRAGEVLSKVTLGAALASYDAGTVTVQPGEVLNVVFINDHATGSYPKDRNALIGYAVLTPTTAPAPTPTPSPVPKPTPDAKPAPTGETHRLSTLNPLPVAQAVYDYLCGQADKPESRVLLGTSVDHSGYHSPTGYARYVDGMVTKTGKAPAFIETGYTDEPKSRPNAVLLKHWEAGGLGGVQMHIPNPWDGDDSWVADGVADKRDLRELLSTAPDSAAKRKWFAYHDSAIAGFLDLQSKNVALNFRPLHELNGHHFYWGWDKVNGDPEAVKELWRDLHAYYTKTKGVRNLIWVYSVCPDYDGNGNIWENWTDDVLRFYPGNDVVDVVGLDIYKDDLGVEKASDYDKLVSTGKPLILAEAGPQRKDGKWDTTTILRVARKWPKVVLVTGWHSWDGAAVSLVDNLNLPVLVADPLIVTRDKVTFRKTA